MGEAITTILSAVGITGVLALLFKGTLIQYLSGYLGEKGKRLAMKEDIEKITNKIESVKHEYAKQLEEMKADFSTKLKTNSYRYEKEFLYLERLTEHLHHLKNATIRLCWKHSQFEDGITFNEGKIEHLGYNGKGEDVFYIPTHTIKTDKNKEFDDWPTEFYSVNTEVSIGQVITEFNDIFQKYILFIDQKKVFLGLDLYAHIQQINETALRAVYLIQRNKDNTSPQMQISARAAMLGVMTAIDFLLNRVNQRLIEWEPISRH